MTQEFYFTVSTSCRYLVLILFYLSPMTSLDTKEFQKNLPAKIVWAVPGNDAELPCDVTPALPGDNVTMIFWFKDNMGMPLYSLDARGGPLDKASHLAMSDDLGGRSYFIADDEPSKARLRIQNVQMQDEGVFRCRVDFVNSPTRNFQVNLTLVVQPSAPRIFDAEGREVKLNSATAPFLEGSDLFLSCQVTGGRPKPTLTWWYNGTILDGVIDSSRVSFTTVNQLMIKNIPRHFKGAKFQCRASSSEIAGYVVREVPVTVFLKPSKVKIVSPNDLLSIRKSQNIRCETSGSYPPAKLTWLLDGKPIRNAVVTEEETDTFTGSILSLNLVAEDDGKDLVCRADNPRFPGGSAEDIRQIHVAYPPKVAVKMDSTTVTSLVREGTEVRLRCETSARPPPHSYSWYQDNHLVPYNESSGILPMDNMLTLKKVTRNSAGQYVCSATNSEGETYSPPFDLGIQYAPRCRKGYETMRVGALPDETLVVQCHVDSVPSVTKFSWTYNTSKGVLPVQSGKMQNHGNISILHFTPGMDEVESLSCWATNNVGRQQTPCLFFILPAAAPEPPKSCIVRNASHGGLEVSCIAGKDGGLHQSFILEVSHISITEPPPGVTTLSDQGEPPPPLYRVLGERPVFRLHSLQPGREYQVLVYAENAKGKSNPPVVLPNVRVGTEVPLPTLQESDTTTGGPTTEGSTNSDGQGLTLIMVGLAAAAVLLIVSIVAVAAMIACRRAPPPAADVVRRRERRSSKPPDEFDITEAGFGEGFHRRSAQYRASMYGECEERISRLVEGPDLILAPVSFPAPHSDY